LGRVERKTDLPLVEGKNQIVFNERRRPRKKQALPQALQTLLGGQLRRLDAMNRLEALRHASTEIEVQKDESHFQNEPDTTIRH
jgi:hypothetical protein